jgi:hypothetical protein
VTAIVRVVEPTVGVFAYEAFFGHVSSVVQHRRGRSLELGRRCHRY